MAHRGYDKWAANLPTYDPTQPDRRYFVLYRSLDDLWSNLNPRDIPHIAYGKRGEVIGFWAEPPH